MARCLPSSISPSRQNSISSSRKTWSIPALRFFSPHVLLCSLLLFYDWSRYKLATVKRHSVLYCSHVASWIVELGVLCSIMYEETCCCYLVSLCTSSQQTLFPFLISGKLERAADHVNPAESELSRRVCFVLCRWCRQSQRWVGLGLPRLMRGYSHRAMLEAVAAGCYLAFGYNSLRWFLGKPSISRFPHALWKVSI